MLGRPAVFLDRDGVLVRDVGPLTSAADIALTPEAPAALAALARAGFALLVVSNQTVLARGLLDEPAVRELQREIARRIMRAGGPALDGFYFCPHHPSATRLELRCDCDCRKPAPGLLLRAASEHGVSLEQSFMIGDRPSDVLAGKRAGCKTVQLTSGAHSAPLIEVTGGFEPSEPDFWAPDLSAAALFILGQARGSGLRPALGGAA